MFHVHRQRNITLALVVLLRQAALSTRAIRMSLENRKKHLKDMLDNHRLVQEQESIYGDVKERLNWRIGLSPLSFYPTYLNPAG